MIFDRLERLAGYVGGERWDWAREFVAGLSAQTPDGRYEIAGAEVYALVASYPTVAPEESVIENHRRYIDLQLTLCGCEGIDIFTAEGLRIEQEYDAQRDITFYVNAGARPLCCIDNCEGFFTLLFPHDLHRPKVRRGECAQVKKAVVKVLID